METEIASHQSKGKKVNLTEGTCTGDERALVYQQIWIIFWGGV